MTTKQPREADQVMVVIQLSQEGQTTLQWALNKCQPGDSIAVLHVVDAVHGSMGVAPGERGEEAWMDVHKEQIGRACCALLFVFKELCEAKQIKASVRVAHGADKRRVIVEEATAFGATKLVLGAYGSHGRSTLRYLLDHLQRHCVIYSVKAGRLSHVKAGKALTSIAAAAGPLAASHQAGGANSVPSQSARWERTMVEAGAKVSCKQTLPLACSLPATTAAATPDSPPSSGETTPNLPSPTSVLHPVSEGGAKALKRSESIAMPAAGGSEEPGGVWRSAPGTGQGEGGGEASPRKASKFRPTLSPWRKHWASHAVGTGCQSRSGPAILGKTPECPPDVTLGSVVPGGARQVAGPLSPGMQGPAALPAVPSIWAGTVLDSEKLQREALRRVGEAGGVQSSYMAGEVSTGWHFYAAGGGCWRDLAFEETNRAGQREAEPEGTWTKFARAQLEAATESFAAENLIGKGGCSKVYRGALPDGRQVAIKRMVGEGAASGRHEWQTEVAMMAAARHRHVVSLLGYCQDARDRILVYELMENGNLEERLRAKHGTPLEWASRFRVALEAARGVEYLHWGCPQSIIHRDIKSSNILLGEDLQAKVSDFGLATWNLGGSSSSSITAEVVGTFGYLAPEYFLYGQVSEKTDVYSFGVVLLELVTGRMPIDVLRPKGEENLVLWAKPLIEEGKEVELVDPRLRLEGRREREQAGRMLRAAALCLRNNAARRPSMREVVRLLEEPMERELVGRPEARDAVDGRSSEGLEEFFDSRDSHHASLARKQFTELVLEGLDEEPEQTGPSARSVEVEGPDANANHRQGSSGEASSTSAMANRREGPGEEMTSPGSGPRPLRSRDSEQGSRSLAAKAMSATATTSAYEIKVPMTGIWAAMA